MTPLHCSRSSRFLGAPLAILAGVFGVQAQPAQPPAAKVSAANVSALVNANSQFAFDLLKQINATAGADNIFLSPYSVSSALAMAYAGSRNATQKQMAAVLHFNMPDAGLLDGSSALLAQTRAAAGKNLKLDIANALWGEKSYPFAASYIGAVNQHYGGGFNAVDFLHNANASRLKINQSVAATTESMVPNLLGPGDVNDATRLVLTSAIYFKGSWQSPFETGRTRDSPFTLATGSKVTVPLMEQVAYFRFVQQDGLTAVELPYKGGELSMIAILPAILPDAGAAALASSLTEPRIQALRKSMSVAKVDVYLPRFKFQTRYNLEQTLSKMGMTDAFDASRADFSGMDGKRDLAIGKVIHQAVIEVNEVGSEAAAATAVTIYATTMAPGPPEKIELFLADRPFLFLIVHNPTGSILFLGRVSNPPPAPAPTPDPPRN
jgi:serpin B